MKQSPAILQNNFTQFLFYKSPTGQVKVEIFLRDETVWLTQEKMGKLFDIDRSVITKHLKNIFTTGELKENSVCAFFARTANDGKQYQTKFYNLDAIIAVGYRVNSKKATHFRIWATDILKEYIIKGFAMDDERLKDPYNIFGKDYFEEQLARIRNIRSSERRFYQKITDIYAQCSADYDSSDQATIDFFATVQNKLHYAITGHTAAEIIFDRVKIDKPNMGLTNWKYSPHGPILKTDISIAKNYLTEKELDGLNRIVTMYLDYAESQAHKGAVMYMKDWIQKLNLFLQFNEKDILSDNGRISHEVAIALAESEYDKYQVIQDKNYISDFDEAIKTLPRKNTLKVTK